MEDYHLNIADDDRTKNRMEFREALKNGMKDVFHVYVGHMEGMT